jgi:uncharacterized protein YjbJ (UPF0337 family)
MPRAARFGSNQIGENRWKHGALDAPGGNTMGGKTDQLKGRVKEAAGVLTGDKRLEREGKVDRAVGSIKEKLGEVAEDVKEETEDVMAKVKSTMKRPA